jgi:hypothetical protein
MMNVAYNDVAVISRHEGAEVMFHVLLPIINIVMFPIAIVLVLWRSRAALTAVRQVETSPPTAEMRRLTMRIPLDAAVIGVGCWIVAGLLWPVVLNCCVALTLGDYLQFLASLVMCGVMSAVHTFFVTAVFAVRVLLPALWRKPVSADRRLLERFDRKLNLFLALGFAVPFLGIALISTFQAQTPAGLMAMRWLSAAGLFGALFTLALDRWLRHDIETLESALDRE